MFKKEVDNLLTKKKDDEKNEELRYIWNGKVKVMLTGEES